MHPRRVNSSKAVARIRARVHLDVKKHILILICIFVPLWLQAQVDTCNATILAPVAPVPAKPPACPSPPPPPASPPDNLADATKSALACAWIDGPDSVLKAFRLLTTSPPVTNTSGKVLEALHAVSPQNDNVFQAALGNPDAYGVPQLQGLPDLVDTISKASRRGTVEDRDKIKYQIKLFSCTQFVIDELFKTDKGKTAIAEVNDAFTQKNNYIALYKLLQQVWSQNGEPFDADHLEKLRAAFGVSADNLAKQVAAKIAASKN